MSNLSDFLPAALQVSSTVLETGSRIARGNAAKGIGQRRQALAEFEAQQLEQEAQASEGAGMRVAADERLKASVVNSLALARAAASGAGASDPTVLNIMAQTSGESAYRQAMALYEGEAQARMDRIRGTAVRYGGATAAADAGMAKKQADLGAVSTVLSGGIKALSMYQKYWAGPMPKNEAGLEAGTTDNGEIS